MPVPDAHEKTTLFYGWYSNPACAVHADRRRRGYRRQHGLLGTTPVVKPAPEATDQAPLEVRRTCLRRAFVPSSGRGAQARRARLIRKVYEVDPLLCPHCGGTMKVIAVIEPACADTCLRRSRDRQAADRRPAIIRQILEHLGLPTATPSLRAPPDPPDGLVADPPRAWSSEPFG